MKSEHLKQNKSIGFLDPNFTDKLANCETNEDLFSLVIIDNEINPDAIMEIRSRDLSKDYFNWKNKNNL